MNSALEQRGGQLFEYLRVLRRWRTMIAAVFVGTVLAAWLVSARMTPVYQSITQVEVQPFAANATGGSNTLGGGDLDRQLRTEVEVLQSRVVLTKAAESLGLPSIEPLKKSLTVKLVTDTRIVEISVEHELPEEAASWADAIASAYITYRQEEAVAQIVEQTENLTQRIDELRVRIAELDEQIADDDEALALVNTEREGLINRQQTLEEIRQSLPGLERVGEGVGRSINPAEVSESPVRPRIAVNLGVGGVIGFLLAVGLALLIDGLSDRVSGPEEVESRLETSILGHVPEIRDGQVDSLVILDDPVSGAAEAHRTLRTNLRFLSLERPLNSILVTSAVPGEGKTTTAANLAVAFAQSGAKTLLLSADLRRPTAHKLFGLPDGAGLVDGLNPERPLDKLLQPTGIKNFRIMTAGGLPPNPTEILGSARFSALLSSLTSLSEVLLVDAPPVLGLADASALASKVDGVLVVVDIHKSTRRELSHAAQQLRKAGGRIIGAVVNSVDPEEGYGYYYPHYYAEIPEDDNDEGFD